MNNETSFPAHLFTYNSETGAILRNGIPAGSVSKFGYIRVAVGNGASGGRVMAHRLAWRIYYGAWPNGEIDHIDHVRSNNKIRNLRLATTSQNVSYQKRTKANRSGVKGVCFDITNGLWAVSVQANKRRHVWRTHNPISAAVAAPLIRRALHGEFACE